ncbi:GNAT family N-acetyltransferase [Evansella sp. AB-P1]|uniref:GNAT family N-acetyltransferase n=1 Tax=Evansella sp. AB-P1 TaxID=3037653 RepID=UPI00241D9697|nr:GNAT family N-acetyltransferase [Evansella sp. AB-P1]MDG5787077.1 GNAT family N-acetyltransferase [Evansella sp. AB-P1]
MKIRQASSDDWKGIARVHVDCIHSDYEGILPPSVIEKFTYKNREDRWQKDLPKTISGGTMNYVVENNHNEIVGFALGGTMRDPRLRIGYTGELYGIYIHPDIQGQGFGRKLFESVAQNIIDLRHSAMAVWTFKNHPSCSFFNALNGKEVYEKKTTIAGKELNECAFGWDDLHVFTDKSKDLN